MGLVLRLPGFGVFLLVFVVVTISLWVMAPERGPSTLAFALTLVFLQIGYLAGALLETTYLSKLEPSGRRDAARQATRKRSYWLK